MWLYLPPGYSPSAPDPADSTSALEWRTKELEQSVTLNETHSRSPIWSRRWKRASWTRPLFGAILPPSIAALGVERWIGSLLESPASPTALPDDDKDAKTTATSGPTPAESSRTQDPALSSWRKLQDSLSISTDSQGQTLEDWVTRIRSEFSAREKSGMLRAVSVSLLWRTPTASDAEGGVMELREEANAKLKLRDQAANWPPHAGAEWATPAAHMSAGRSRDDEHWNGTYYRRADGLKVTTFLTHQAQNWPALTLSPEAAKKNSNAKNAPKSLIEAAAQLRTALRIWPTPTVSPGAYAYNRGDSSSLTLKLDGAARDWPTVTAADADRSSQTYPRGNDTLDGAVRRFPQMEGETLDLEETDYLESQLMWPTLLQTDSEDPKRNGPNGGISLSEASRCFPTPRHSEGPRGGWDGPNKKKPIQPYEAYSRLIEMTTQHGHICSRHCRRLNPLFAAWLMGLPTGWSTLATGVYESPYLETAWSHWWRLMLSALFVIES